jgi:hypothetical protein
MKRLKFRELFFYVALTTGIMVAMVQFPPEIIYQLALFLLGYSWRVFTETDKLMNRAASKDVRFSFIRVVYLINKLSLIVNQIWIRRIIQIFTPYILLFLLNWSLGANVSVEICLYGSLSYELIQYLTKLKRRFLPQKNGTD